jgi:hypothetical protein
MPTTRTSPAFVHFSQMSFELELILLSSLPTIIQSYDVDNIRTLVVLVINVRIPST